MSRDKQIEEMANIIALKAFEQAHYVDGDENLADIVATELYEKGYRKASEVAEEIFDYLDSQIGKRGYPILTHEYVAELKEKYT